MTELAPLSLRLGVLLQPSELTCAYCGEPAVATIVNGAEVDEVPCCGSHAAVFLTSAAVVVESFDLIGRL